MDAAFMSLLCVRRSACRDWKAAPKDAGSALASLTPPVPTANCMVAAAMSPGLHERGNHAVRFGADVASVREARFWAVRCGGRGEREPATINLAGECGAGATGVSWWRCA